MINSLRQTETLIIVHSSNPHKCCVSKDIPNLSKTLSISGIVWVAPLGRMLIQKSLLLARYSVENAIKQQIPLKLIVLEWEVPFRKQSQIKQEERVT